jgi:hypothetical protein
MALQNWQRGDVISALRLQKLTEAVRQNSANIADIRRFGGFAGEAAIPCMMHNALGRDIDMGECIGIGNQAITGNTMKRVLDAEEITESKHRRRFAIVGKTFKSGIIQPCYIGGICQARVNVEDENHIFATPRRSHKILCSDVCGPAIILWAEGGTGVQWAVVYVKPHVHGTDDNPYQELEEWDLLEQPDGYDGIEMEFKVRPVGDDGDGQWMQMRFESLGHLSRLLGPGEFATTTRSPTTTEAPTTTEEAPTTTFHDWPTPTPAGDCGGCESDFVLLHITIVGCSSDNDQNYVLEYISTTSSQCLYRWGSESDRVDLYIDSSTGEIQEIQYYTSDQLGVVIWYASDFGTKHCGDTFVSDKDVNIGCGHVDYTVEVLAWS